MVEKNVTQLFGITPDELKESIINDVRTELQLIKESLKPTPAPIYLTRKETAKILKVSLVTLHDWNKKGILKPYRLGNLIRYKSNELEQALISINNK